MSKLEVDKDTSQAASAPEMDPEEAKEPQETVPEEPYTVFKKSQLVFFLSICAVTGMISPLTASVYLPALNAIEEALHISTEHVNLTVTVYVIFQAISPTFWGTIADSYGRRPVFMATMIVYCGACIGLALSKNYASLIVCRMLQAFGSSSVIAVGAGVIGDIADTKRRGSYFGIYSIGQLLGPVLGPIIGGIVAEKLGWKWIFWVLLIIGALSFVLVGLFVPETLRTLVGNGSGYANPTPSQWLARRRGRVDEEKIAEIKKKAGPRRPLNFLQPLVFLLEPDVFLSLFLTGVLFMSYYYVVSSTTKQFSINYGLSELQIGLCFICQGVGTILGSFIHGKILDRDYRKYIQKTKANPEIRVNNYVARLRSTWYSLLLADVAPIIYGWIMYIKAPLGAALVLQFFIGFSTSAFLVSVQALIIDLFPDKASSVTASNNLVRCILGAVATVSVDPGIENVGIGWMFTITGILVTICNVCVPALIKFGPGWQKRRDEAKANGHYRLPLFHI